MLNSITPFFIVDDLRATLDFYESKLGFTVLHRGGGEGNPAADYWAMISRDSVTVFLKAITPDVHPVPNHTRHEWARWDAYVFTADPDALYAEYTAKAVPIHAPLADTDDGLRAFEICDNSGYVFCFGRPIER